MRRLIVLATAIASCVSPSMAGTEWPIQKRKSDKPLVIIDAEAYGNAFNATAERVSRSLRVKDEGCKEVNGIFTCLFTAGQALEIRATPDYGDRRVDRLFIRINTALTSGPVDFKTTVSESLMLTMGLIFPKSKPDEWGRTAGQLLDAANANDKDGTIMRNGVKFSLQTFRKDAWVFTASRP